MTPGDVFERAARRFVDDLANERGVAGGQVSADENKDKKELVVELEDNRLGGDRLREGVALLELDGSGEDVVEHVREEGPEPEKVVTTIKVDGQPCEVEVLRYSNGSMKDAKTGKWLAPPSPNVFEDPQKARSAVAGRHAKVLEQAREGLVKGVNRSGEREVETPAEAWAAIVEEQAVLAMGDKRGSTASARLVGSATKMIGEEKEQPRVSVPGGVVVVTDFESILLGMFNRVYPDDPALALVEMKAYRDGLNK